ncbi:MAG: hypothetical protein DMG90_17475 [Acidobacteria bacterium]|nr:MAG: hypothetical protein DMG91_13750 [Acidobacteriota bacterium]PYV87574.1 MAG: hypothetical protein DMG90_17475 [Acidobacteriota bacterium]
MSASLKRCPDTSAAKAAYDSHASGTTEVVPFPNLRISHAAFGDSFAPSGLDRFLVLPMACVTGCIVAPLRG